MAPPHMTPTYTTKIKVQLKLAIARLRMLQKRDDALSKSARRTMAQLLDQGKIDSARIRVENIIRTDITIELHEILELFCELLLARAGLLEGTGPCDPGLEEAVKSLIYAAPKTEVKELQMVRQLLAERFGKDFVIAATEDFGGGVNEKVVKKLMVAPPKPELVQGYLEEIAKAYGVTWPRPTTPEVTQDDSSEDASSYGGEGSAKELKEVTTPVKPPVDSPVKITPRKMSTDNVHPKVTLDSQEIGVATKPKPPAGKKGPGGTIPDISELEKRFAALKK